MNYPNGFQLRILWNCFQGYWWIIDKDGKRYQTSEYFEEKEEDALRDGQKQLSWIIESLEE